MAETSNNWDQDDYWGQAVTLFTGYALPGRSKLFTSLTSKEGSPLFRMDIQGMSVRAVTEADYSAITGWGKSGGEDYDLAFYDAGGDGAHDSVSMRKARIVLIGVPLDDKGRARLLDAGETSAGGKFTGIGGDEWDFGPLGQYVSGSKIALDTLVSDRTTRDFAYNGLDVKDAAAVDLDSFERTGQSFDRTIKFFINHAETLQQWETSLGSEQAAWKGKAAGLFWHLVHMLNKNYDSYVEQLGGTPYTPENTMASGYTPQSKLSDALAKAQQVLITEANNLRTAWTNWASTGQHDPHRALLEVLDELSAWVLHNNVPYIQKHSGGSGYRGNSTAPTYSTTAAYKEDHPEYGDLNNRDNWKKVGDEAVKRWNQRIENDLIPTATVALTNVKNAWIDVQDAFDDPLETKSTSTLAEAYQDEKNEIAEDEAKKNSDDLNNSINDLNDNMNDLNEDLNDSLNDINDGLNDNLNNVTSNLNDNLNNVANGLNDNLNNVTSGLNDNLNDVANGLNDNLNNVTSGLNDNLNDALGDGSTSNLNDALGDGSTTTDTTSAANLAAATSLLNGIGGVTSSLNDDGTTSESLTNPDGSTTQLNADGSVTTTYPDGTTQTIDPTTGDVTTTSPDGTVTTSALNAGGTITNPDGSTTRLNSDGTLTTDYSDGTSTTIDPSTGDVSTTNPDGTITTSNLNADSGSFTTADGASAQLNSDGSLTTTYPDGSTETIDPTTGTVTTTSPDGTVTTTDLNPGGTITNPDGSTTTLNSDGTLTTTSPDGTTQTLNPDTGELTTTNPDGTKTTTDLTDTSLTNDRDLQDLLNNAANSNTNTSSTNSLNDTGNSSLDSNSSNGSTSPLNSGSSGLTSSLNDASNGSSYDSADYEDYDSTPYTGGSLRAGTEALTVAASTADTSSSSSGTPLNPAGMGGMGGMGGGGGNNGSSERTRNVLTETGGATTRGTGRSGSRAAAVEEDEDMIVTRGGTTGTSSSPFYPMGGGGAGAQGGQATESGDRQRSSWVPEDEDVWGTEDGGAPAVLGR